MYCGTVGIAWARDTASVDRVSHMMNMDLASRISGGQASLHRSLRTRAQRPVASIYLLYGRPKRLSDRGRLYLQSDCILVHNIETRLPGNGPDGDTPVRDGGS